MNRLITVLSLCATLHCLSAEAAQQNKAYRVGVIHSGGPYQAVVDGLRLGLKQSGYQEGKHILLEIRDTKTDPKLVEEAAKVFEGDRVNLIYAVTTSITAVVKDATNRVPIVFSVGTDPVKSNLVQSFGKPGGRLTGVQYSTTDLTGKRLEILKEVLPKLSVVIAFYNPNNRSSVEAAALAREAAKQFGIQLLERHAASVEDLRQGLAAIKAGEANAYFYITDAMVNSQARLVVDAALSKKLPAMFSEQGPVVMGGLASYGQNFHEVGRLSAKYVQKVLTGAQPGDLRVETVDKYELVINLKTAKQIGLTISPSVLGRADKVIR
jgi:putative ABC transport system substrate-binding protein